MPSRATASKRRLVDELVTEFRISGNQDSAFDNLAAERLGVNGTDLHCLNAIENSGGLTAGRLASEVGLTTGAVTGVIDRLERAGFARRVPDPDDRRRVRVEVTPEFYARADKLWGPLKADWESTLAARFSVAQLESVIEFLRATNELGRRHLDRLSEDA
jgi:DNA-binding MarR family transcriptional regulator